MSKILDVRHPQHRRRSSFLPEDRRVGRVLLLAFAFFLSGLLFFVARMHASREAMTAIVPIRQEPKVIEDTPLSRLSSLPPPSSYRMFQFHAGMEAVDATTTCTDRFSVVMVFQSGVDYRADPQSALYNAASPCTQGAQTTITIPLSARPFVDGNRYYIVRAQQGDGTWYNPY